MIHERSGAVRQQGDAVLHVWLLAQSRAALVKGQHVEMIGKRGGETGEHRLIALGTMDHDKWCASSAQLVGKFNSAYVRSLHMLSLGIAFPHGGPINTSSSREARGSLRTCPAMPIDSRNAEGGPRKYCNPCISERVPQNLEALRRIANLSESLQVGRMIHRTGRHFADDCLQTLLRKG